jgi:hypothetical protein
VFEPRTAHRMFEPLFALAGRRPMTV